MILPAFLSTLKHISFRTIGNSINLIRNLIGRELDVIHEADFFLACKKHSYMVRRMMCGERW